MKAVSLSPRIRYIHCPGEEGQNDGHGVLILQGTRGYPTKVAEIETQADFKLYYTSFVKTEQSQLETAIPSLVTA